jgi:hypothetical protein
MFFPRGAKDEGMSRYPMWGTRELKCRDGKDMPYAILKWPVGPCAKYPCH